MNDPQSFPMTVAAEIPLLRRVAIGLCKNRDQSDDLVQDTVLAALAYQSQFKPGTNLRAWLIVILKNKFRSLYRKRKREVEDPDDMLAKSVPFDDSPLKKMEAREALSLVEMMPPVWRDPLRMLADGATYDEIAIELNEHVGTIKSRINRARTQLAGAE